MIVHARESQPPHQLTDQGISEYKVAIQRIKRGVELSDQLGTGKIDLTYWGLGRPNGTLEYNLKAVETLQETNITGDAIAHVLVGQLGYHPAYAALVLDRLGFDAQVIHLHLIGSSSIIETTPWPRVATEALKAFDEMFANELNSYGLPADSLETLNDPIRVTLPNVVFPEDFPTAESIGATLSGKIRSSHHSINEFIKMSGIIENYPLNQAAFTRLINTLVFAHMEGDAIALILDHIGISFPRIVKYLNELGFEAELMPLAPGEDLEMDVRRFPKTVGDRNPANYWMLVQEGCSPSDTAELIAEERPYQRGLCGLS